MADRPLTRSRRRRGKRLKIIMFSSVPATNLRLWLDLIKQALIFAAVIATGVAFADGWQVGPVLLRHLYQILLVTCPPYILVQYFFIKKFGRTFHHRLGENVYGDYYKDAKACFIYMAIAGVLAVFFLK